MSYKRIHNYVNTSEGGPIRKGTHKYKVLEFIYYSGVQGRRYTDIVRFIVEELNGGHYTRSDRGYWATNLLGSRYGASGILRDYCEKEKARPAILDNAEAKDAYIRRVNANGAYGLTDRQNTLALEYSRAKDKYENSRTGGSRGNWVLIDEKLIMHFGGGDGKSKKLEILRAARATIGLPNLSF